jgi:hypothetical protein
VAGLCVYNIEPCGAIERRKFVDEMSHLSASQKGFCFMQLILRGHKDNDKVVPLSVAYLEMKIYIYANNVTI